MNVGFDKIAGPTHAAPCAARSLGFALNAPGSCCHHDDRQASGLDVCTMLEWSTSRHPNIAFFIVCGTDVPVRVSYLYISCEPFVPHRDESNSDRDRSLSLSVDHDNDQLATHLRFSRVLL